MKTKTIIISVLSVFVVGIAALVTVGSINGWFSSRTKGSPEPYMEETHLEMAMSVPEIVVSPTPEPRVELGGKCGTSLSYYNRAAYAIDSEVGRLFDACMMGFDDKGKLYDLDEYVFVNEAGESAAVVCEGMICYLSATSFDGSIDEANYDDVYLGCYDPKDHAVTTKIEIRGVRLNYRTSYAETHFTVVEDDGVVYVILFNNVGYDNSFTLCMVNPKTYSVVVKQCSPPDDCYIHWDGGAVVEDGYIYMNAVDHEYAYEEKQTCSIWKFDHVHNTITLCPELGTIISSYNYRQNIELMKNEYGIISHASEGVIYRPKGGTDTITFSNDIYPDAIVQKGAVTYAMERGILDGKYVYFQPQSWSRDVTYENWEIHKICRWNLETNEVEEIDLKNVLDGFLKADGYTNGYDATGSSYYSREITLMNLLIEDLVDGISEGRFITDMYTNYSTAKEDAILTHYFGVHIDDEGIAHYYYTTKEGEYVYN